jgi:hypothetical protein
MTQIKMKTTLKIINHLLKIKDNTTEKKIILKKDLLAYLKLHLKFYMIKIRQILLKILTKQLDIISQEGRTNLTEVEWNLKNIVASVPFAQLLED